MQVTTLPLYTALSKEDHKSCRNLEWFPWLGFHRTGSSVGRTCRRTWIFAWFKGLAYTYEGTVEVISGDWMLNSPPSVLAIIIDNYFNIRFFQPFAQITNCYVTDTWNDLSDRNTITRLSFHKCRQRVYKQNMSTITWLWRQRKPIHVYETSGSNPLTTNEVQAFFFDLELAQVKPSLRTPWRNMVVVQV